MSIEFEEDNLSFLNNFWTVDRSGMDKLLNYMYSTHKDLNHLHTVYTKRAQLEYEYSQILSSLSLFSTKKNNIYYTLHLELEQTSKSHLELSNQLQADVAFHLRNKLDEYELLLHKWRMTLEELFDEKEQLTLKLLKIQAKYLKEHELSHGKPTPSYESLKEQYKLSVAKVNTISEEWNVVWKDACRTLEAMEEDRVEFIKINMWDYTNNISESLLVQDNWCEKIRVGLEKYNVEEEVKHCIKSFGTGSHIPTTKDCVDHVYQSQKTKKNRREKLENQRQLLRIKKQQSMNGITTIYKNKNTIECLERSKSLGDLSQENIINQKNQISIRPKPSISKSSNVTHTRALSRSDSESLPRQPYEYKPDTGSFPSRKGSSSIDIINNNPFSGGGDTIEVSSDSKNNIALPPSMIAPKSPRPSPYSSLNISTEQQHVFGQSYPPSSYFQHQPSTPLISSQSTNSQPYPIYQPSPKQPSPIQPFFNQYKKAPLISPSQPIPLPINNNNPHHHHHRHHYKSAPNSPVGQRFVYPLQSPSCFMLNQTKPFGDPISLPPLPPNFINMNQ